MDLDFDLQSFLREHELQADSGQSGSVLQKKREEELFDIIPQETQTMERLVEKPQAEREISNGKIRQPSTLAFWGCHDEGDPFGNIDRR